MNIVVESGNPHPSIQGADTPTKNDERSRIYPLCLFEKGIQRQGGILDPGKVRPT
jgi:hypothetical protein